MQCHKVRRMSIFAFFTGKKTGSERVCNLFKITELEKKEKKLKIGSQGSSLSEFCRAKKYHCSEQVKFSMFSPLKLQLNIEWLWLDRHGRLIKALFVGSEDTGWSPGIATFPEVMLVKPQSLSTSQPQSEGVFELDNIQDSSFLFN